MLLLTGIILFWAEKKTPKATGEVSSKSIFHRTIVQAIAILPGISEVDLLLLEH